MSDPRCVRSLEESPRSDPSVYTKFARAEVPENTDFGPDILEHMPGAYVLEFEQCTSES